MLCNSFVQMAVSERSENLRREKYGGAETEEKELAAPSNLPCFAA